MKGCEAAERQQCYYALHCLGGERLTPKALGHYLHHNLVMLHLLWCFFAHLLILEDQHHHQNLINSSLYHPGPLHKILSRSIHNCLSYVVQPPFDNEVINIGPWWCKANPKAESCTTKALH